MATAQTEFLQSQWLDWDSQSDLLYRGLETKTLSLDCETGARTRLQRFSAGWRHDEPHIIEADEELFVLSGSLTINGCHLAEHSYAYLPAGYLRQGIVCSKAAVVLAIYSSKPTYRPASEPAITYDIRQLVEPVNTMTRRHWEPSVCARNSTHMRIVRKTLRIAPDRSCRTYLLSGLAHGRSTVSLLPRDHLPYTEEFFLISGDMRFQTGIMRPGAYFSRPSNLVDDQGYTQSGFLLFCRAQLTGEAMIEWPDETRSVTAAKRIRPDLPNGLSAFQNAEPQDAVVY